MQVGAERGGRQRSSGTASAGSPGTVRRSIPLVAWVVGLTAVLAGAVALGSSPSLAAPPVSRPGELSGWLAVRGPVQASFAVLRLVVVVLAAYLLLATVLAVAARLCRPGRMVEALDARSSAWLRHIVEMALGAGLVGVPVGVVDAGGPVARSEISADLLAVETLADGSAVGDDVPAAEEWSAPPTMQRLDPPGRAAAAMSEVVIGAGDHLWSVAERALAVAWGRPPVDAEVAPFWQQVVEVNRPRLADPANPDLLFVGQVVAVPVPPAAAGG